MGKYAKWPTPPAQSEGVGADIRKKTDGQSDLQRSYAPKNLRI